LIPVSVAVYFDTYAGERTDGDMITENKTIIRTVLFDFGGVIAEEGYVTALSETAREQGLDPETVIQSAYDAADVTGFPLGRITERDFWPVFFEKTGLKESAKTLKERIFADFRPRQWMMDIVDRVRGRGVLACLLSDHSSWLEELDDVYDFFSSFDRVFNSYRHGRLKRDPATFDWVLGELDIVPRETLLIDDSLPNIESGGSRGLHTVYFDERERAVGELISMFPFLADVKIPGLDSG